MKNKLTGVCVEIEVDPDFEEKLFGYLENTNEYLAHILRVLNRIDAKIPPVELAYSIIFNNNDGQRIETMLLKVDSTPKHVLVKAVDSKGNDAKIDGAFLWSSSDETVATVVADADGSGATVSVTGVLGECLVTARADADLGEGVKEIIGTLPVLVEAGEAVEVRITEG